jgi:hypothetical protein
MATTLRQPFRGRDVYALTVRGQTANAAGTLSNVGALQSFIAIVDEVSFRGRAITELIQPITGTRENNVIVEKDDQIVLREILRTGQDNQLLALTFYLATADFALFNLQRGYPANIGAGQQVASITFYGLSASYREVWTKGKCTGEMVISSIDVTDQVNPLYAMAATA